MLRLSPDTRVFLCTEPTDMRKSFNGLAAATTSIIGHNPTCGHLFAFVNRRRDMAKILYFERGGFCLWAKRLEQGRFAVIDSTTSAAQLSDTQLMMWLDGIDLDRVQARRFKLPQAA